MPIRAIETSYDGYLFRSRLEARWAVFFNTLKIRYEYEKEGYKLSKPYLPDFWLPTQDCWVEIKPTIPTQEEQSLTQQLGIMTRKYSYIFFGPIPSQSHVDVHGPDQEKYDDHSYLLAYDGKATWDYHYCWCECLKCGALGIAYDARTGRLPCHCASSDKAYNGNSPELLKAYAKARAARF